MDNGQSEWASAVAILLYSLLFWIIQKVMEVIICITISLC